MQERILAEAELQEGVIYRLTKKEYGYAIQRTKGEVTTSNVKARFSVALGDFIACVVDAEVERSE